MLLGSFASGEGPAFSLTWPGAQNGLSLGSERPRVGKETEGFLAGSSFLVLLTIAL